MDGWTDGRVGWGKKCAGFSLLQNQPPSGTHGSGHPTPTLEKPLWSTVANQQCHHLEANPHSIFTTPSEKRSLVGSEQGPPHPALPTTSGYSPPKRESDGLALSPEPEIQSDATAIQGRSTEIWGGLRAQSKCGMGQHKFPVLAQEGHSCTIKHICNKSGGGEAGAWKSSGFPTPLSILVKPR